MIGGAVSVAQGVIPYDFLRASLVRARLFGPLNNTRLEACAVYE